MELRPHAWLSFLEIENDYREKNVCYIWSHEITQFM